MPQTILITDAICHDRNPARHVVGLEQPQDLPAAQPAGKLSVEQDQDQLHAPRDIEHDNPEFRRLDETVHFLEQIYGRKIDMDDAVTVVRFSQISNRPPEITERLRGGAPAQN